MRILVVDDDLNIRESLKKSLEADYFAVDTAADGQTGSYLGRIHDYDAIILDKLLPKKCGLTVCREIRESGRSTPIIILSVKSGTDDRVSLLDIGADDYVAKPFSYRELRSRLRAVMRRPQRLTGNILRADDLEIDSAGLRATRAGRELRLTKKEFSLLELLVKNAGQVISRAAILEHVWGDSADPFSNTVEAHVRNLRRKIEGDGEAKLIRTVPGHGYRVDA